ncbi:MAG: hypothetical protein QM660_00160 [Dysgonomonas sp.]
MENWKDECDKKTIYDLRFIIDNKHAYSNEQLTIAELAIEQKRTYWKKNNKDVADQIDMFIRKHLWFDFHVTDYDGYKLSVMGSTDLSYYHMLEIVFENVFFISGIVTGWHSETNARVFSIPDNEYELNVKYEIEQDYQLFVFKPEDYKNDIIIAAHSLTFDTTIVQYNLK